MYNLYETEEIGNNKFKEVLKKSKVCSVLDILEFLLSFPISFLPSGVLIFVEEFLNPDIFATREIIFAIVAIILGFLGNVGFQTGINKLQINMARDIFKEELLTDVVFMYDACIYKEEEKYIPLFFDSEEKKLSFSEDFEVYQRIKSIKKEGINPSFFYAFYSIPNICNSVLISFFTVIILLIALYCLFAISAAFSIASFLSIMFS